MAEIFFSAIFYLKNRGNVGRIEKPLYGFKKMITLNFPPIVENMIIQNAKEQGITPECYIMSFLPHKPSFYEARGILEGRLEEALAFQEQLRNEWDSDNNP